MANAKCLRIAAALSVSEAARNEAATGRNGWTGALRMDHAGPHSGPSRGGDIWSREHNHPQTGGSEGIPTERLGRQSDPQSPLPVISRPWTTPGRDQIAVAPRKARDLQPKRGTGPSRQHSCSLSYLSLPLWCVAPRSGWLGSCASPPQGRRQGRAIETETPARLVRTTGRNGWQGTKKQHRRERRARLRSSLLLESRTCPALK